MTRHSKSPCLTSDEGWVAIGHRLMPKLSLRDLFAVMTIVALALGWALDHQRLVRSLSACRKWSFHWQVVAGTAEDRAAQRLREIKRLKEALAERDQTS